MPSLAHKPVDRAALLEADCVSGKFLDELTTLAKEKDGDAEKLLGVLAAGDVRYWRSNNTDRLREYFEENGFLSTDQCLLRDEIHTRLLAAVADHVRNGTLSQVWIDRLVAQLQC